MGIGFAIPSKTIKEILSSLKEGKEIVRGYLGVRIVSLDAYGPGFGKTFDWKATRCAVEDVYDDTPASKAGLKMDDVVLSYNNKPTKEANDLTAMVTKTNPGTKVNLKVWRIARRSPSWVTIEKQPVTSSVGRATAAKRERGERSRRSPTRGGCRVGITVEPLTENWPSSTAGRGIRPGQGSADRDRG